VHIFTIASRALFACSVHMPGRPQSRMMRQAGGFRKLLDKAKEAALAGTGTATGQTFVAAVDQVIHALSLG